MNAKRLFMIQSGLIVLFLIGIIGGSYETIQFLTKQSNTLVMTKAKLDSLDNQQIELAQAKRDIKNYAQLYSISQSVVPQNKDESEATRQIINLANQAGVTIDSITFPASTLGGTALSSTSTTATEAAPSIPAGNPNLSQLEKVPKIPGVYEMQLVVTSSSDAESLATYPELIKFLTSLEQNRTTAQVSELNISPASSDSTTPMTNSQAIFQFELTLNIYIKPQS